MISIPPSLCSKPVDLRRWLISVQENWLSTREDSRSWRRFKRSQSLNLSRSRCTCYTVSLALVRQDGPIPIFLNCKQCVLHRRPDGWTDILLQQARKEREEWLSSMTMAANHKIDIQEGISFECAMATPASFPLKEDLSGGTQASSSSPPITSPMIGSPTIQQHWLPLNEGVPFGSSLSEIEILWSDMEHILNI